MTLPHHIIAKAIDSSPMNRGISGSSWLASKDNIPISFINGDIALFERESEGIFEGHLMFVSRGRQALEHTKKAFQTMFVEHGAKMLFGLIPDDRKDAKLMVRWTGAKSCGKRHTDNGVCELFTLTDKVFLEGKNRGVS